MNSSSYVDWSDITAVTRGGWKTGGEWKPSECQSRYHVALIIASRDQDSQLRALLRHLIPVLRRQFVHFRIFVVDQVTPLRHTDT